MYINLKEEINLKELKKAAQLIKRGGIAIFPTETVYGIGANGLDESAISKLYEIKQRPLTKPISLLVNSIDMINSITENITKEEYSLIKKFMPGPLTIILKKKKIIPDILTANSDTVGIRMPENEISLKLIEYAFKNFTYINANDLAIDYFENWKNENLKYLTINKSSSTSFKLEVKASKTPILSILKNETNDIKTSISIKPNLEAPLYPDSVIGSLTLSISDRNLITLDIINTDTIKKKNIPFYLKLFLSNYSNILEQILK